MVTSSASTSWDIELNQAQKSMLSQLNSKWKMKLYMFSKMSTGWWWGLSLKSVSPAKAEVVLPYGWRTQNPFRSTYFAAQCGAAELSTGVLANLALQGNGKISMLVAHVESEFTKKATKAATFTCEDGEKAFKAVQEAIDTGEARTVKMASIGKMADGTVVSKSTFTWTFKKK